MASSWQSIYSFRAATVRNILDFPDQFSPKAEIVTHRQQRPVATDALDHEVRKPADWARTSPNARNEILQYHKRRLFPMASHLAEDRSQVSTGNGPTRSP